MPAERRTPSERKAKRRAQEPKKVEKEERASKRAKEEASSELPPELWSDRLAQLQREARPDMAGVEAAEASLVPRMILDTSTISATSLGPFLQQALGEPKDFGSEVTSNGSPALLVLTGAAVRAAELSRDANALQRAAGTHSAKLFGKHFKLADQVTYLAEKRVSVAVGTPTRVRKLLEHEDGLKIDNLAFLVFDCQPDSKSRTVLDSTDSRLDVFEGILARPDILARLKAGTTKLLMY